VAIKYRNKTAKRRVSRFKKKMRIRKEISGTTERPRLTVYKSLSHIYAQLIDDTVGRTLVTCSTVEKDLEGGSSNRESAKKVGALIAKRAKEKNIINVVFDRNGYRYHGKIKELADSAREAGLKF
jgi:large subunit ribosomal protein L18